MKIIQSYWSLPSENNEQNDEHGRSKGGWLHHKYNLMSWAFSCLKLREFYDQVELITDKKGKELLIDKLQLPYTSVKICLDEINNYNSKLWALGKIYAYQIQDKPFLHVDGDVYIWNKFSQDVEKAQLVVQNIEVDYPWYGEIIETIKSKFSYVPSYISKVHNSEKPIISVCAGIMGGTNNTFFKKYTAEALNFVEKNYSSLNEINIGLFNTVFEQYLFYCMAEHENINIFPCFPLEDFSKFSTIMSFNMAPLKYDYIHIAGSAKKDLFACEQLELRLYKEYPNYYNKIIEFVNENSGKEKKLLAKKYKSRFKELFDILYKNDIEFFLNRKLSLNRNVKLSTDKKTQLSYISYRNPITEKRESQLFSDFDFVLNYFKVPCSGSEILSDLSNEGVEITDEIKIKLIDYLTDKLLYHRILDIA